MTLVDKEYINRFYNSFIDLYIQTFTGTYIYKERKMDSSMEVDSSYLFEGDQTSSIGMASPGEIDGDFGRTTTDNNMPPPPAPSSTFKARLPPPIRTTSSPPSVSSNSPRSRLYFKERQGPNTKALESLPLEELRKRVLKNIQEFSYSGAIFYSNILVTATDYAPEDVFLLASSYFGNKEYHRVLHLLEQNSLLKNINQRNIKSDIKHRFMMLAGQSYMETEQFEECVTLLSPGIVKKLGVLTPEEQERENKSVKHASETAAVQYAARALLVGKAYESLDNRVRAIECYKKALDADVYCAEAYQRLVDNHLLTSADDLQLLQSTNFNPGDEWLCLLYQSKILKHGVAVKKSIEQRFQAVDDKYGMATNPDVAVAKAECYLQEHNATVALRITNDVRARDPFHMGCIVIYLTALVDLGKKSELFLIAHQLVDAYPKRAVAWFAVGCYYYCVNKFDPARRYFNKATTVEPQFAPAWIGFGNAFAAQDESDQAMAAYRTAARLFPGSHIPLLCSGMEYLRTNNLKLSEQLLLQSREMCPTDPLVYNEAGVVFYKQSRYEEAVRYFLQAHETSKLPNAAFLTNLGHAYRKIDDFENARRCYQQAIGLEPREGSTYAALGLIFHLQGQYIRAVELYHQALGLKPGNTFASTLLNKALNAASYLDVA